MINQLCERYPVLTEIKEQILQAADLMESTAKAGKKILLCGNGGSAADCDHIVGELMKGFMSSRKMTEEQAARFAQVTPNAEAFINKLQRGIPAISLPAQAAVLSAFANDVDAAYVYAQLVFGYGTAGDLLIALSTSGNSKNVVNAVVAAKALGLKTLAFTGANDSQLSALCDITLKVPQTQTYLVQELHLPVYHYLCAEIERRLFGE